MASFNVSILFKTPPNNPASTLNSSDGYQGIGLGSMYTYNTEFDIAAGLYYLRFKKSKTSSDSNPLANITGLSALNDNDAWIFGLKLAHHF